MERYTRPQLLTQGLTREETQERKELIRVSQLNQIFTPTQSNRLKELSDIVKQSSLYESNKLK